MKRKNTGNEVLGLRQAYFEVLQALAIIAESRNPYSRGHSKRVAFIAREIAEELGCPDEVKLEIEMAARIHDIGKIGLKDEILFKPGPLTPAEWAEMMQHPSRGAEMIRPISFLKGLVPIIESHHEHFDGTGYPRGLKGEEIPLGARILAVADAYDTLNSERSYRSYFGHEQAIKMLKDSAGVQWDSNVVAAFLRVVQRKVSI